MQHSIEDYAIAWDETSRCFFNEFTSLIKPDLVFAPLFLAIQKYACFFRWHDTVDICSMSA